MNAPDAVTRTSAQRAADGRLAWLIVLGSGALTLALLVVGFTTLSGRAGRWIENGLEQQRLEAQRRQDALTPPSLPDPYAPDELRKGEGDDDEAGARVPPPPVSSLSTAPGNARPLGDVAAWVTPDDYPAASLKAGEEGRTKVTLIVAGDGRPTDCLVAISSGYPALDRATCEAMLSRGRFNPPGGTRRWTSPFIRWQIPA